MKTKKATQEQIIFNAFSQTMFEYKYRYSNDPNRTIYTNWLTEGQFKSCYPNVIVISKTC